MGEVQRLYKPIKGIYEGCGSWEPIRLKGVTHGKGARQTQCVVCPQEMHLHERIGLGTRVACALPASTGGHRATAHAERGVGLRPPLASLPVPCARAY